jgi:hypothetical protein|tara:strand:+ start:160 stop:348 length:189 start_codon:yes stop_codon:yes gene_type:complete
MELEHEIKLKGYFLPEILKEIMEKEFEDKEWDFVYGSDEYNRSITKYIKEFKRLWQRTRYSK